MRPEGSGRKTMMKECHALVEDILSADQKPTNEAKLITTARVRA